MSVNFLATKACPVIAVVFIYWIGSFNLPNIYFLPIATATVIVLIYITKKFGNKSDNGNCTGIKKK